MLLPHIPYYDVLNVLNSSGGMGIVYYGIDLRSGYPVAIKELYEHRAKADFMIEYFIKEANDLLYLSHPNISRLVDFVNYNGKYYLIMEYVEGMSLNDFILTKSGPIPQETALPLFSEILETVAFLHSKGWLHRDIKPGNIMVTPYGHVKLLDLGIAVRIDDPDNNSPIIGTPSFMPPEHFEGNMLGRYSDIFALGVTLYMMLTGRLPYQGHSSTEIWAKIKEGNLPDARQFYPFIDERLATVILPTSMDSDKDLRYQTCEEFLLAINSMNY